MSNPTQPSRSSARQSRNRRASVVVPDPLPAADPDATVPLMTDISPILRADLYSFIQKVFATLHPSQSFLPNWHIEAIVHELMEITRGTNNRLIVNQPPRSLKSISMSVAYVAWRLGRDPSLKVAVASYSNDFATELHRQFRRVIDAPWYRELFPRMVPAKDVGNELVTTENGGRFATSVGGVFTGRGADLIIIDDAHKEDEGQSEVARRSVREWFTGTIMSRLNDKATSPIIVVMQRLHQDDLSGFLLERGGWRHLKLPAIATEEQIVSLGDGRVHIRQAGEALHPARESLETLGNLKRDKGSLLFGAHYQQEPVPPEGNLIKGRWFPRYKVLPESGTWLLSLDIASATGDKNDYSVCVTFLKVGKIFYIVDVWRGKLEYPSLRAKVIELARLHRSSTVLIEEAGPGLSLVQHLRFNTPPGMGRPIGVKPEGSKEDRMVGCSATIEAGSVYLPEDAPWLGDFLNEVLAFPRGRHDDQVDALSQGLNWLSLRSGYEDILIIGPEAIHGNVEYNYRHY